ncbi:integrase core domain-containing protein [Pseudomonadales bacterium]|nr:integrase core domain-containing protein [Pseudomonadales bacterium]MDB9868740.1 integrase core domain-containing protein [Pseudomonadales bacterium]
MIAHGYLDQIKEMEVTWSHSRPGVSNDNAFSESQFKTQKSQPDYPDRYDSLAHARDWCEDYFDWYNFKHHHSGLAGFAPEQVFTSRYKKAAIDKQQALDARYALNPESFVNCRPMGAMPPLSVAINPIVQSDDASIIDDRVNFPTLTAAGYVK